jgi:gliding motility-associatede transport system auxiliary component
MTGLPSLLAALGVVGVGFALLSFLVVIASGTGITSDLGWIGANLVIGIALLVAAAVMNVDALRERLSSGEARRAGKYGTSAVASTLLAIAILGMLGFLSTRYHHRFDWSEQKIHTLSDQSIKVLQGLGQDVQATALVNKVDQGPIRELLDKYAYQSDRFKVDYADPNERPGLLEQFHIQPGQLKEGGLVRIAIGGESVEVSQLDEDHVTNAMVKLTRTGEKVVYFVTGHGEHAIEGQEGADREGYARAAEALKNENYRVESLLLGNVKDVPDDADVVIVAGATRPLFDEELGVLDRYLARGGAVLALVDPRVSGNWITKLRSWGANIGDDIVVDRALALFGRALTPFAGVYNGEHPITKEFRDPRNDAVIFHEVRSVRPADGSALQTIVSTSEDSWAERNLAKLDSDGAAALDDGDLKGPVSVMIAGPPALAGQQGEVKARLVVSGDTNFASNEFLDAGRNRDLFLNSANWLMGDVQAIAIRPNSSRPSRFQLTSEEFHAIRSASLFVLPELIAVLGVFTWWSRRNPAPARQ